MRLLAHLNSLPLLRPRRFLPPGGICLLLRENDLPKLAEILAPYPQISLKLLIVLFHQAGRTPVEWPTQNGMVPVLGPEAALLCPHLEKAVYIGNDPAGMEVVGACRIFGNLGLQNFYILADAELPYVGAKHDPAFFQANGPVLERVYNLLEDEASRNVFAARIKAIITGEAGYMPISGHMEYFHPQVRPETGDIMLDGGVSFDVEMQKLFVESVGPGGIIFGFEPMGDMFAQARDRLGFANYHLFRLGVGARKEILHFTPLADSSHISQGGPNTIPCEVTDIDSFVQERSLLRVDCLKLDVEGAELAALLGAEQTIRRYLPKLIVCLYHKNEDLLEIPVLIKKLNPGYKLYIAHSSYGFTDTVLYARVN